jgi:xanthine dehydrogenase YagS FAD-binding subunit
LKNFRYIDTFTIEEAISLLTKYKGKSKIFAGGIDLIHLMKQEITNPEILVNIKTIPNMKYIKNDHEGFKIGALTTLSDIGANPLIQKKYPILTQAVNSSATPQLRNVVTIGGNLCQDIWCLYYRAPNNYFNCLRKGGQSCYAKTGDHRYMHSIFGEMMGCFATNQSGIAVALIAMNCQLKTTERTISMNEFYTGLVPSNILKPNEIITEIQLPSLPNNGKLHYITFHLRKPFFLPLIHVAIMITHEGSVCTDPKIVLGGLSYTPFRAKKAEQVIKDKTLTEFSAENASRAAVETSTPLSKNDWKVEVTKTLVKRVLIKFL